MRSLRGVFMVWSAVASIAGSVRAEGLVEEPVDAAAAQAERDYRAGIRATRAGNNEQALGLFEKALPRKHDTSDIFYNLVQVARATRALDKVVLYGQGFLTLEPDSDDAKDVRRQVDAGLTTLASRGRSAVACTLRVPEGATVFVNEVPVADQARPSFKLAPGRYSLRVDKVDHHALQEPLVVGSDPITRDVVLERIVYRAKVKILSNPADGVQVLVDGVRVGETPLAAPLDLEAQKKLLLRFEKAGFEPWVRYVELGRNEILELKPALEKLKTPTP